MAAIAAATTFRSSSSSAASLGRRAFSASAPAAAAAAAAAQLKQPALHDFHAETHGATMVDFAGWSMPLKYPAMGDIESHLHCRSKASIFDVSHMLQILVTGADRAKFLESLVVADVADIAPGSGSLSLLTTPSGGIIDDLIINNRGDDIHVVLNAGCADKDYAHITSVLADFEGDADVSKIEDKALLAVQGPSAAAALQGLVDDSLDDLPFMHHRVVPVMGVPDCQVTRCGYTGEDGFEISVPEAEAEAICSKLLSHDDVALAGLGVRDSLRLEAGLCLYGNDIDDTTTPVSAGLTWTIGKRRREEGGFPGSDIILEELRTKSHVQRRAGFTVKGRPARSGAIIFSTDEVEIGRITSGLHSPSLKKNIACGYIDRTHGKIGDPVLVKVGKKMQEGVVSKMVFVPSNYYRGA